MEEKERYEVKRLDYSLDVKLMDNNEPDWRYIIFDSVNDEELAKLETVCDWLNQKDKRIKELQEKLSSVYDDTNESLRFARDSMQKLIKENQQLKQKIEDQEESYNNTMRYLNKTRSELLNLPKKIVCEISEAIERLSWRKRIYTNWEFDKEQLYKDLDTILKKYGG